MELCDHCHGSGAAKESDIVRCSDCNGAGRVQHQVRTPFGMFAQTGKCRSCNGQGSEIKTPCEYCDGMGRVRESRKMDVKIPKGVDDGMRLRLEGEGEAGLRGSQSGDLYVQIQISPHEIFKRDETDVSLDVPIPFATAVLGGEVKVPILDGTASLTIPEGTQCNTVFRMRGKGIPSLHGSGRGDQHVRVIVEVPTKLTKTQKDLLRDFDKTAPKRKKGLLERVFD